MMKWERLGLIFDARGAVPWAANSALQPTPLVLPDRVRVYAGFRDSDGVSRIGFVDLSLEDPTRVIGTSKEPVLDIGRAGAFDEFGVVPSAVIQEDGKTYLYYAGYQRGLKVRFLVLGGLAVGDATGSIFSRNSQVPVFERTDAELLFRVPHSVIKEGGRFRFWYGGGSEFRATGNRTLPAYDIRTLDSSVLTSVPDTGVSCLTTEGQEYRLGRPYVIKRDGAYVMFFGWSTATAPYQLGLATSQDGIAWIRQDSQLGLPLAGEGSIDSEMMAYPAFFSTVAGEFLLYSGNNYGEAGFCMARLATWG